MPRPATASARELILPTFTQWEKVGSVTGILADLTNGYFSDAALLLDQLYRDDRVRSAWTLRLGAVLGLPSHMEPAKVGVRKQTLAKQIADKAMELWPRMVPTEELTELLFWGDHIGAGVAREEWVSEAGLTSEADDEEASEDDAWLPTLTAWHCGALRMDVTDDTYKLRTQDKGEIPIERDDKNWLLYTPYGHKYGRLRGLLVSLVMLALDRGWVFRDRARHSEVYGQPTRVGITPLDADQREKDGFRRSLASPGTETVVIAPQSKTEGGWDLKLVEAQSNAHQTFSTHIDHVDRAISMLYNGQAASMEGASGLSSQEKAGDTVMRYMMRFVAKNISSIADKVLGDWCELNYGDRRLAPKYVIEVEPPEDASNVATTMLTLGKALDLLKKHGVDVRAVLEEAGVPLIKIEEAIEEEMRKQQIAQMTAAAPATSDQNTDEKDDTDSADDTKKDAPNP